MKNAPREFIRRVQESKSEKESRGLLTEALKSKYLLSFGYIGDYGMRQEIWAGGINNLYSAPVLLLPRDHCPNPAIPFPHLPEMPKGKIYLGSIHDSQSYRLERRARLIEAYIYCYD